MQTQEIILPGAYLGYMLEVWDKEREGVRLDFPAGNGVYRVELTLGGAQGADVAQVLAFPGRRMLPQIHLEPGQQQTYSFALDVRFSRIQLLVEGTDPAVLNFRMQRADEIPTVFLLGDSTVCDQEQSPYHAGWGELLPVLFDENVNISNHARCGYSTQSFIREQLFLPIMERLKPGDVMMMQFAHNDQKDKTDRYAPAYGAFTDTLRYFIKIARQAGATPVLVTSQPRRHFDENGHIRHTLGDYPDAMRKLAAEDQVALIDLNRKATAMLEAYGDEESKKLFAYVAPGVTDIFPEGNVDDTHFSYDGALKMASLVLEGMQELGLPVCEHIRK